MRDHKFLVTGHELAYSIEWELFYDLEAKRPIHNLKNIIEELGFEFEVPTKDLHKVIYEKPDKDFYPEYKSEKSKSQTVDLEFSLGRFLEFAYIGQKVKWVLYLRYHRTDNQNGELLSINIDLGLPFFEAKVRKQRRYVPLEVIPVEFTWTQTKESIAHLKKNKRVVYTFVISGIGRIRGSQ